MKRSNFALISLILGIVSFIQLLGVEKGILGIIFGIVALREMSRQPELKGRNLAIIGIVLGVVYIIVLCIFFPYVKELLIRMSGTPKI